MKTILVDAYHCLFTENGINKEMQEILDLFPNKKIVLTNADDEQMVKFGIDKSPYEVFTLKHSPDKTDNGYYKKMLEHFNLKAEDCIYIEHDIDAIQNARFLGIDSFSSDKISDLKKNIKRLLGTNKYSDFFIKTGYLEREVYKLYKNGNHINYIIFLASVIEMELSMINSSLNELNKIISSNNQVYIPKIKDKFLGNYIKSYEKIAETFGRKTEKDIELLNLIRNKRNEILHNKQKEKSFFKISNEIKNRIGLKEVANLRSNLKNINLSIINLMMVLLAEKSTK